MNPQKQPLGLLMGLFFIFSGVWFFVSLAFWEMFTHPFTHFLLALNLLIGAFMAIWQKVFSSSYNKFWEGV